ncbi:hypothetical protein P4637_01485 [Halalkalibacterium halodurans]|uniref:BH1813 protein n=1 Tax=Halalkalibacterium halodurans (strain ATCC BAA-125 / DSM 18197 / FERM 7344 / JCM 9153 / C-125) TaxID=272558 RepID=Q9KBW1_HALH5|nr:hypothetical protein [Halalkalibacterium halodurans]MED3646341.1 hypothetical protein [Halalkalibacterium halodurans]MED4082320.1 hypothetical protein [Halalkalibacterium halodurans]MED4083529.1 hypothetical protein [Halalkalibacterium halodurans]MED4105842.1 hypothetical protein [Halalkalibacterium halodurans]MED4109954.1 hypothetical protein [Halalkalibacterium halodurans]
MKMVKGLFVATLVLGVFTIGSFDAVSQDVITSLGNNLPYMH